MTFEMVGASSNSHRAAAGETGVAVGKQAVVKQIIQANGDR